MNNAQQVFNPWRKREHWAFNTQPGPNLNPNPNLKSHIQASLLLYWAVEKARSLNLATGCLFPAPSLVPRRALRDMGVTTNRFFDLATLGRLIRPSVSPCGVHGILSIPPHAPPAAFVQTCPYRQQCQTPIPLQEGTLAVVALRSGA